MEYRIQQIPPRVKKGEKLIEVTDNVSYGILKRRLSYRLLYKVFQWIPCIPSIKKKKKQP